MKPVEIKDKFLKGYSVAPYNFVSLPKKAVVRYNNPKELPAHNGFVNRKGKELLSGTIEYTIEAKTPIMVAAGKEDKNDNNIVFFKDLEDNYAIPGNTIRGVLRTNCQILSFSNIVGQKDKEGYSNSEIEDSRFLFRDVAGGNALTKKYKDIMNVDRNNRISRNLKAGYIINENNKYYIKASEKLNENRNYFRINEIDLRIVANPDVKKEINFMYQAKITDYAEELNDLNKLIHGKGNINWQKKNEAKNRKKKILECNKIDYKPYISEISFGLDNKKSKIINVGKNGEYSKEGYLLSGGFIGGKMSHYIVPAPDRNTGAIDISSEDIKQYKDDLVRTKKMNKEEKINKGFEFFDLPSEGETKPIFYIKTNRLHFGFTPNIRMFYSKSVLDGVSSSYKDVKGISHTDAIFGFTDIRDENDKKYSYKSRVSFEDAIAKEEAGEDRDSSMKIILAEPKPTSYNLYLQQKIDADKKELNIYEDDFNIRGIKQYWLKDYVERPEIKEGEGENMISTIHPLKEGTSFNGRISFRNLEEDELGLLLWALRLEENCYQSIGLAKSYGFGRVQVTDITLKVENLQKKYNEFSFDFVEDANINEYIEGYKSTFSDEYLSDGKKIEEQLSIREFIYIKKTVIDEKDRNWYRYMDMDLKEFNDRRVLPTLLEYYEYVKKEKPFVNHKKSNPQKNYKQGNKQKGNNPKDITNKDSNNGFGNKIDFPDWFKNNK